MPSRRGVQGVAMGVANRLLVITQEEVAGPEIRLQRTRREEAYYINVTYRAYLLTSAMSFGSVGWPF